MARTVQRQRQVALTGVVLCALLSWAALLLFTYYTYPAETATFFAFFLLLMVALSCTLTPVIYVIGLRFFFARSHRITLFKALVQGCLFSLAVILNLILRALHSWNLIMAVVIMAAVIVVEILLLARKV